MKTAAFIDFQGTLGGGGTNEACKEFDIDLEGSYVIGDNILDAIDKIISDNPGIKRVNKD